MRAAGEHLVFVAFRELALFSGRLVPVGSNGSEIGLAELLFRLVLQGVDPPVGLLPRNPPLLPDWSSGCYCGIRENRNL